MLVLHGEMGNWPTSIEIRAGDIPSLLMHLRLVILSVLGTVVLVLLALIGFLRLH
jgi:hypothetical protein